MTGTTTARASYLDDTPRLRQGFGWAVGFAIGMLMVGNPVSDGARLNLDLVAIGDRDVPPSLFAMGAELPRFPPYEILLGGLPDFVSDATIAASVMILIIAVGIAGMFHHLRSIQWPIAIVFAVLYGVSPLFLTRLGVGHLGAAASFALLPWAFSTLIDPLTSRRMTGLWLGAFAACGYYGALTALPVLLVGAVAASAAKGAEGPQPRASDGLWVLFWQIPWLVPAILVRGGRGDFAGSDSFVTELTSIKDAALLPLGHGFWLRVSWIGADGWPAILLGVGLLVLAVFGFTKVPPRKGVPMLGVGTIGLVIAVASVIPAVASGFDSLTSTFLFSPIRESHKLIVLFVFVVMTFAARGVAALPIAHRPDSPGHLAAALAVAAFVIPVAIDGRSDLQDAIEATPVPAAWDDATRVVSEDPGVVISLPWSQYYPLDWAGDKVSHNALPALFPVDVISRHDLNLPGQAKPEARDAREPLVETFLRALSFQTEIKQSLTPIGATWIAAIPAESGEDIERLRSLDFLDLVIDEPEMALFKVSADARSDSPAKSGLKSSWNGSSWLILVALFVWLLGAVYAIAGLLRDITAAAEEESA